MVDADRTEGSRLLTGPTGLAESLVQAIRESNQTDNGTLFSIADDSGRDYTPEQRRMFKATGRDVSRKTIRERAREIREWARKSLIQGIFDQFDSIKKLSGKAYALARLSKGSAGAFEALLRHGKLRIRDGVYDADRTGGAIDTVFAPLGKEATDFLYWIAGNRAERLMKEGREHLFTKDDIAAAKSLAQGETDFDYPLANGRTTRDRAAIFADALVKFNAFNQNVLDMAEQSGLIDKDSRRLWEHDFYVPFYRVAEEDGAFRGMTLGKGLARQKAFEKLRGGKEALNDLLANTLMNWAHLIDASAKNRAALATLQAAEKLSAARKLSFADRKRGAQPNVWVMEDGKKVEYIIDDPHLLIALNALDFAGLSGPAMDALSATKRWLTIGVTASPFFKVRNLIRDSVQAIGTGSGLSYNPLRNIKEGYQLTSREQQEYVSALASGALIRFGTMLEGNEASRVRRLIRKGAKPETILDAPGKVRAFYEKILEPALNAYHELGNRGEEINRMALYHQLIQQGRSHAEASLMARDLMDFSMQGSFTTIRFLTQVVPFMNARLQGLYKLGRAAKDDPARLALVTGAAMLMSVALLARYQDDDDWRKREDWDRDNYWWFKFGGIAYRIPKPFEIGALGTLAERTWELAFDDEMNGERFRKSVGKVLSDQLAMNPVPQLVRPILDIYANRDSFTDRPIESMAMERLQPEYRYRSGTSLVARGASQAIGGALSPVQIDHLVRGYFSWLGAFAVGAADMALRAVSDEPSRPASDMYKVMSGGMISQPEGAPSRYVTRMYEQAKIVEEAYGSWRQLQREGRAEEAAEFRRDNQEKLGKRRIATQTETRIREINARVRDIERSAMPPAMKRDAINHLRRQAEAMAMRL
jgi:hypothetical protein